MAKLQEATRTNSKEAFRSYSELADANTRRCMLRGLFSFRAGPIPIDEVEPAAAIVVRSQHPHHTRHTHTIRNQH